ncbi:hypothetical protein K8Q96_01505 [Candidatus Nomurabacteria bacterium]|nr:hypothetical protein [Candidatus Nomurabacteria bacterium]
MKTALKVIFAIAIASVLFLTFSAIIGAVKEGKVIVYNRLQRVNNDGQKEFNPWGLLSPVTVESQKIVNDTVRFSHSVVYPIAPSFKLVEPKGNAEAKVASEIAKAISKRLYAIQYRIGLDYDGQAIAVRKASNPNSLEISRPKIDIQTTGTASPESAKDGFEKSIRIGHFEPENAQLAKERLVRTNTHLVRNTEKLDADVFLSKSESKELQLSSQEEVEQVLKNPALLDAKRFVTADVMIITQRLVVTPVTSPFLLLLALAGLLYLLSLLRSSEKEEEVFTDRILLEEESSSIDWLNILFWVAVTGLSVWLLYRAWWLFVIIVVSYLLYRHRHDIGAFFRIIWILIAYTFRKIWTFLLFLFESIMSFFRRRRSRRFWKKMSISLLLFNAFLVLSAIMGWILICRWYYW